MSRTIEDNDPSVGYTGPWGHYNTTDGAVNASIFSSGTVSVCGTVAWDGGNCEARIPFHGTGISIFGDSGGQRGQFYCRLETASGVPEGLWTWRDAGAYSWGYRTKVPLCMVSSIPNGSHVAVLGVYVDDVVRGTSFDFAITNQTAPPGNKYIWDSVLADAVPPLPFRNTTDLPLVPAFTAVPSPVDYKTDSYVYTSAPYSSSSKAVPLGVGLGVGLGGAGLLALLAALWLLRRRGRARQAAAAEAEAGEETLHGGDDGAKETETPLAVIVDGLQEEGRAPDAQYAAGQYAPPPLPPLYTVHLHHGAPYPYPPAGPLNGYSPERLVRQHSAAHSPPASPLDDDLPNNATLEDPANFARR